MNAKTGLRKKRFVIFLSLLFFSILDEGLYAQMENPTGKINGRIVEQETKAPIPGANVLIIAMRRGTSSEANGSFTLDNVPVGNYSLQISCIGYETQNAADVIVRPARTTTVALELKTSILEMEGASITSGYFSSDAIAPASTIGFSSEEIRRAPGSAGDVSRILYGLPGVAKANDERNNLIVRGGSPIENSFYVENIEFPNINHFPTQGSSGGAVSILNVDLIKDVNFRTGGFPASYGDRLSSIMEISLREGNREKAEGQVELSFAGAGAVAEGPLPQSKGSWIVSARRSYVDLLADLAGFGVAPKYGDVQGKVVYDINQENQLTAVDVFALDLNTISKSQASDLDFSVYGEDDQLQNSAGLNVRTLWSGAGYSNTSLSHTVMRYTTDFIEGRSDRLYIKNRSTEQFIQVRHGSHVRIGERHSLELGGNVKYSFAAYRNYFGESTTFLGETTPSLAVNKDIHGTQAGGYVNYTVTPWALLDLTLGGRVDYFTFNEDIHVSPRVSFCVRLSDITSVTGAAGIYFQSLPYFFLSQNEEYKKLNDLKSTHVVLGVNHYLSEDTKATIEVYYKKYEDFPMDPAQPSFFSLDEIFYGSPYDFKENNLAGGGTADASGIECTVQKKLALDFYGLASASYATARYRALDGVWRDRIFSNKLILSVEGGYKPNSEWEFSARWIFAGGTPYTPFDIEASRALDRGVLDETRTNAERNGDYHSLNVRADKRFNFSSTNLVVYLSIWNVYNRRNVATHYWNEFKNEAAIQYQWSILPVLGLEYEF